MDHDDNGNLSQEEWTGSYLKLLGLVHVIAVLLNFDGAKS